MTPSRWKPDLHPRGRDGRFIKKFGWVSWLMPDGRRRRGQVTDIEERNGAALIRVTDTDGGQHALRPDAVSQAQAPKASLAAKPTAVAPPEVDIDTRINHPNSAFLAKEDWHEILDRPRTDDYERVAAAEEQIRALMADGDWAVGEGGVVHLQSEDRGLVGIVGDTGPYVSAEDAEQIAATLTKMHDEYPEVFARRFSGIVLGHENAPGGGAHDTPTAMTTSYRTRGVSTPGKKVGAMISLADGLWDMSEYAPISREQHEGGGPLRRDIIHRNATLSGELVDDSVEGLITHEFGHVLSVDLRLEGDADAWRTPHQHMHVDASVPETVPMPAIIRAHMHNPEEFKTVSKYGGNASMPDEEWAESFTAYELGKLGDPDKPWINVDGGVARRRMWVEAILGLIPSEGPDGSGGDGEGSRSGVLVEDDTLPPIEPPADEDWSEVARLQAKVKAAQDAGGDDLEAQAKIDATFAASRDKKRDYYRAITEAVVSGRISPEDAEKRWDWISETALSRTIGGDHWAPLPEKLYHVTNNADGVRKAGTLYSRSALNMKGFGKGLGGGSDDSVSFTDDPEIAESIKRAMLEAAEVASGRKSVADLIEAARTGSDADTPYLADALGYWKRGWVEGDPLPPAVQRAVDGELDPYEDSLEDQRLEVFKIFAPHRSLHGGPMDPLFFGSDAKWIAQVKPEDVEIIEVHPEPGTYGGRMGALGEYRLPGWGAGIPVVEKGTTSNVEVVSPEYSRMIPEIKAEPDYQAPPTYTEDERLVVSGWTTGTAWFSLVDNDGRMEDGVPIDVQRAYASVQDEFTALTHRLTTHGKSSRWLVSLAADDRVEGDNLGICHYAGTRKGEIEIAMLEGTDGTYEPIDPRDRQELAHTFVHEAAHAYLNEVSPWGGTRIEDFGPMHTSLWNDKPRNISPWYYGYTAGTQEFACDIIAYSVTDPKVVAHGVEQYGWDPSEIDRLVGAAVGQPDFHKVSDAVADGADVGAKSAIEIPPGVEIDQREGESFKAAARRALRRSEVGSTSAIEVDGNYLLRTPIRTDIDAFEPADRNSILTRGLYDSVGRIVNGDAPVKAISSFSSDAQRSEVKEAVVTGITDTLMDDEATKAWADSILDTPIPDLDALMLNAGDQNRPTVEAPYWRVLEDEWDDTYLKTFMDAHREDVAIAFSGEGPKPKTLRDVVTWTMDKSPGEETPEDLQRYVIQGYVDQTVRTWAVHASDHDPWAISMQESVAKLSGADAVEVMWTGIDSVAQSRSTKAPLRDAVKDVRSAAGPFQDAFTRAVYTRTQALLAEMGFKPGDTIRLFRGVRYGPSGAGYQRSEYDLSAAGFAEAFDDPATPDEIKGLFHFADQDKDRHAPYVVSEKDPRVVTVAMNPASSWSTNATTASRFAEADTFTAFPVIMTADIPVERIYSLPVTGPGCLDETEALLLGGADDQVSAWGYGVVGQQDDAGSWVTVP